METGDPFLSESRSVERPILFVFSRRTWPGGVSASLIADDRRFDRQALLRWADDGGRWGGAGAGGGEWGHIVMSEEGRQPLRPTSGEMLSVKILEEVARIKAKPDWSSASRLALSLVKDDALNILLMVLKSGARLAEHRTKGPIAVHVLSGSVCFSARGKSAELSSGSMAALDREVVHELEALEESIVLLITAIE